MEQLRIVYEFKMPVLRCDMFNLRTCTVPLETTKHFNWSQQREICVHAKSQG